MSYLDTTVITSPRARRRTLLRKRFLRRPMAVAGLLVVLFFVVLAVFAPLVAPHDPAAQDYNAIFAHPSGKHLLGTDEFGRDTFSRIVWGARASEGSRSTRSTSGTTRSFKELCSSPRRDTSS